jgi:hypothetical protein
LLTFNKTDIQIAHPSIVFYDFYGAWNKPIASDVDAYLSNAPYLVIFEGRTDTLQQIEAASSPK